VKIRNPNGEIRNNFKIPIGQIQNKKAPDSMLLDFLFWILNLFRIFVLRISDFSLFWTTAFE